MLPRMLNRGFVPFQPSTLRISYLHRPVARPHMNKVEERTCPCISTASVDDDGWIIPAGALTDSFDQPVNARILLLPPRLPKHG